jgi:hypothetical protein
VFATNGAYSNQLSNLRQATSAFLASLGASPAELQPTLAAVRGNGLRIELELDQRRQAALDPDRGQMPEGVFAALKRLVETWNIYVSRDPRLEEIDAARRGPRETAKPVDHKAAAEALMSAKEFATAEAIDEIQRIEVQAQQTTTSGQRADRILRATWRNLIRTTLKIAIGLGSAGYVGFVVAKEIIPILRWTNDHADFLRQVLADSPQTLSVLESILRTLPPL